LEWRFADMSFSRAHLKLTMSAAMAPGSIAGTKATSAQRRRRW
jgi:hypothetical protein